MEKNTMKKLPHHWRQLVSDQFRYQDIHSALWVVFWLIILTYGNPSLLQAIIGLVNRLAVQS